MMIDINNEESSNVTKSVTSVTEPSFNVTQSPLQGKVNFFYIQLNYINTKTITKNSFRLKAIR